MTDTEDDGFNEETFKPLDGSPASVTPPADPPKVEPTPTPAIPPVEPSKEGSKSTDEEEKPVEKTPPASAPSTGTDDKKPEEAATPPETPETPPTVEPPASLTKDDVKSVVSDLLNSERSSGKELESTTQEVLEKYYPDGLSNTLVDEKSGKELRTPQDVVEASGGEMSTEQAAQWLLNEQFKLDKQVSQIKDDARKIAETTVNFKRDAVSAVAKYEPLFKAYPYLQQKVYDKLMKQVKVDKEKNVVLSAPDVIEHYDDYLEPYQLAFEHSTQTSATAAVPPTTPEPPKPKAEDRMDESGDGGASAPDDPNDFAQQVSKELAKGA